MNNKDIRELSREEIEGFLKSNNDKPFRTKQINEWLWKKNVRSFEEMTNLSQNLRELLKANFDFKTMSIMREERSFDKTTKFVFELHDGNQVEGVLIPSENRVTACISSQVGCPLGCLFCATGTMGFTRNLHYSEIIDQFAIMEEKSIEYFEQPISNIVYMGMGEPLLNYDNVMTSIDILTSKQYRGLSPSRITLSTVGLIKGIRKLADDQFKAGLAISLHSADEKIRQKIMPASNANPLSELQKALQYYVEKTGQRITFEYLLLDNVNDSIRSADKLAQYCRSFPVKINLIEYNSTSHSEFKSSTPEHTETFVHYLETKNMIVNIRKSKGKDIAAACGQLVKK